MVEVFPDILDEEDFTAGIGIVGGTGKGVQEGKVPPGKGRCGFSRPVLGGTSPGNGIFFTAEQGHQVEKAFVGKAILIEAVSAHGAVDRAVSLPVKSAVEQSDVAVPCHPFGILPETPEIKMFQQTDRSISSTGAENGIHGRVIKSFLEVGKPFPVGACILKAAACSIPATACLES
jgi:hypothetical protein